MKKKLFATMIALSGIFMLTFVSCKNYVPSQEKQLSKEELKENLIQTIIIPTDVDTLSFSVDTLDIALQQSMTDMYLTHDCYLAYCLENNETANMIIIPYRSTLGQVISKQFAALHSYKMATFSDKDYEKVSKWAKTEIDKGRMVVIEKDKNNVYTAVSYTKIEYALLMTKI